MPHKHVYSINMDPLCVYDWNTPCLLFHTPVFPCLSVFVHTHTHIYVIYIYLLTYTHTHTFTVTAAALLSLPAWSFNS